MTNTPVNKELYTRVKAEAERKFKSWPSAYGSAWLVKEYKKRGGKYTTSKRDGGMSSSALSSMQSFYKDMQANKYNHSSMQESLDEMTRLADLNSPTTYLNKVESGTGETLYKGPGLFSKDKYVPDKNINIQTHFGPQGERLYKNIYELDKDWFAPTNNLGYGADTPEGTRYMMDMNGNEYSVKPPEMKKGGGIPERYKNMGFTKVGAKKQSTRPGKKWMVLAKKGDDYKVVHGGDSSMKDFSQHGSEKRKDNFWNRMGGRDSAKAKDPFSPLYWHKKFSTWQEGGQFIYDPNNPMPQFEMGNSILDKMKRETMRKGGQPCYECGGMYAAGGTNNPGFEALPPQVQQKIRANMNSGGMTPFNANPNYYGERLEKFIGNVRDTAANNLFPDMEEEVMQMPQARYGMPIYQGDILGSEVNIDAYNESTNRPTPKTREQADVYAREMGAIPISQGGTQEVLGNYSAYPNYSGDYIVQYGDKVVGIVPKDKAGQIFPILERSSAPTDLPRTAVDNMIMVPDNERDQAIFTGAPLSMGTRFTQALNTLSLPLGHGYMGPTTQYENYINENYGEGSASQSADNEYGLIGGFAMPGGFTTISPMAGGARTLNAANRAITSGRQALPFNTQAVARTGQLPGLRQGQLALSQQPGRFGSRVLTLPDWAMRASTYAPGAAAGALNLSEYETYGSNNLTQEQKAQIAEAMNMPISGGAENSGAQGNNNHQGINGLPNESGQNQNDETPQQAPSRPTIAQRWEQATGMPWSKARSLGLTDGNPEANKELIRRIEAGETIEDIQTSMQETIPEVISNNNVNGSVDEVVPETLDDTSADELASESIDYNQGNQGMYTDPNTGMVMNVPQQYFGQQFMQESPEVGMYPQYNPYLQRAQYKYGLFGLGKNLRKVDLQFGMPGQNIDTTSITPDNTGDILKQAGVRPRDIRKAQRQAKQSQKTFNKFVNKHGSPERVIESMPEGSMRGTDRNALMRAMENQGVKPNSTEGQRFEGYDLIQLPSGEYEYRPQAKYGGNNPYLYMYKEGGEYYMDENTINMIMAMGGDIEFLD